MKICRHNLQVMTNQDLNAGALNHKFDPNEPNEMKLWCRDCKGHYGMRYQSHANRASGNSGHCSKCHKRIYGVGRITLFHWIMWSVIPLFLLSFSLHEFEYKPDLLLLWCPLIITIYSIIIFLCNLPTWVTRKEWLVWEEERGYTYVYPSWFAKRKKHSGKEYTSEELKEFEKAATKNNPTKS